MPSNDPWGPSPFVAWLEERVDARDWDFIDELGLDPIEGLQDELSALLTRELSYQSIHFQPYLYALARLMRPTKVVETGVAVGASTYYLLWALDKNQSGRLYSCDPMLTGDPRARIAMAGLILPASRWTLFPEISRGALPKVDAPWDIFVHDSDHGYENMLWELRNAWPRLRPGGILVCDDFAWEKPHVPNKAFREFLEEVKPAKVGMLGGYTAILEKQA